MVEGVLVAESEPKDSNRPVRGTLTVRAMVIRDGTPGISLSVGRELVGEWTDSKARLLSLSEDYKARVHGADGELLYLLSVPGKPLGGEEVSETEVSITFEL